MSVIDGQKNFELNMSNMVMRSVPAATPSIKGCGHDQGSNQFISNLIPIQVEFRIFQFKSLPIQIRFRLFQLNSNSIYFLSIPIQFNSNFMPRNKGMNKTRGTHVYHFIRRLLRDAFLKGKSQQPAQLIALWCWSIILPSNIYYKSHQIPKCKCFSSRLAVAFVQPMETRC